MRIIAGKDLKKALLKIVILIIYTIIVLSIGENVIFSKNKLVNYKIQNGYYSDKNSFNYLNIYMDTKKIEWYDAKESVLYESDFELMDDYTIKSNNIKLGNFIALSNINDKSIKVISMEKEINIYELEFKSSATLLIDNAD